MGFGSPPFRWLDDDTVLGRGDLDIHAANRAFDTELPDASDVESLTGLLRKRTGRLADEGEAVTDDGIRPTVETAEKNRFQDVRIDPPRTEATGNNSPDGEYPRRALVGSSGRAAFPQAITTLQYRMYSREHFAMSIVVGGALLPLVETPLGPAGTVVYAGLVGTLVDLDHFVIARVRTDSWAPLRRAISSPRAALFDQDELFDPGDVGTWDRIASHLLIASLLVVGFLASVPSIALVTAAVLGVHVVADILWDTWRARRESGPETAPDESPPVKE